MDRNTAAARATRAAEAKGHTLGEWQEEAWTNMDAICTRCGHAAFVDQTARGHYSFSGLATTYLCRPSGEMRGPFHTNP